MQIFWVSGPVGKIKSLNLSFKTVVVGLVGLSVGLLVAGSVLQLFGLRLALEYDPQLARRLGNLRTAVELENMNAVYHARLGELEAEHRQLMAQVTQLQTANTQLTARLPADMAKNLPQRRAQGGVYLPKLSLNLPGSEASVLHRMDQLAKLKRTEAAALGSQVQGWQSTVTWLDGLPISLPVAREQASVSSPFGERSDPITQHRAMHTGMDFELPIGTPILAAGSGTVTESGWDAQYGNTIVVQHQDGYTSRYAHANELIARKGEVVKAGQLIARSGKTGRSTGPHLHFEIAKQGKFVDPAPYLFRLYSAAP